jgi:Uma2 family endonuclease
MIGRGTIAESSNLLERPPCSQRGEPVWEVAYFYPRQGDWSETDFLEFETANFPVELVDGCLEFLAMPTPLHQRLSRFLARRLEDAVAAESLGEVLCAPCPVRLWEGRMREPDVFFVRSERQVEGDKPPNGADLVIEIVSPGSTNRERDLVAKRNDYAKAGVTEYWIVDPDEQTVIVLSLDGQSYRAHGEFQPGTVATSPLLPKFQINVTELFKSAQ